MHNTWLAVETRRRFSRRHPPGIPDLWAHVDRRWIKLPIPASPSTWFWVLCFSMYDKMFYNNNFDKCHVWVNDLGNVLVILSECQGAYSCEASLVAEGKPNPKFGAPVKFAIVFHNQKFFSMRSHSSASIQSVLSVQRRESSHSTQSVPSSIVENFEHCFKSAFWDKQALPQTMHFTAVPLTALNTTWKTECNACSIAVPTVNAQRMLRGPPESDNLRMVLCPILCQGSFTCSKIINQWPKS